VNLSSARQLKRHLLDCFAPSPAPHPSIGISVMRTPGNYGVAILLASPDDRRMIDTRRVRALLRSERADIEIEVIGDVVRSSGGGALARHGATLAIGASVGHFTGGDGSLGFFAVEGLTGRRGLVSCNHAIALADRGTDGDRVISPSISNGGRSQPNIVATLDGRYPRLGGEQPQVADCAFAFLNDGVPYDASCVDGGRLVKTPALAGEELEVTKVGYVTNARNGVVAKIEVDNVPVRYGEVKAFFNNVIQIGSVSPARFASRGDSGALVYTTRTFQPVGLLFAASDAGGPHNAGWAWVHPIAEVTRALNVEITLS
jgi:hypothetical protein